VNKSSSKVFLVDDHPLVREWLTNLIAQHDDLTVCGEAESVQQALDGISQTNPDVAIVDLSLAGGSGLDVVKNVRVSQPSTAVIVLSMHDERLYAERALRAGARGYIMKRETTSNIIAAIHEVLSGKIHVSPQMNASLAEKFADGRTPNLRSPIETLSDRELEVFQLLGQGFETRRVAQVLGVSIKTVQAYCARIKEKLELANASELLREAVRWNERTTAAN
jgi:DNA-binding NarL/FixJ family response regulator